MLELRKIAVTGGLSAGKTSVCQILHSLGAHVISADAIVHRLLSPSSEIHDNVVTLLGRDILDEQCINRTKVAKKVFHDPHLLHQLEELLHPAVQQEIEKEYQRIQQNNPPLLFVAEIPLLFESSSEDYFDDIVAVIASEEISRVRFAMSTSHGNEEFSARASRQLPAEVKAQRADFVIVNDGTFAALEEKVKALYETLVTM